MDRQAIWQMDRPKKDRQTQILIFLWLLSNFHHWNKSMFNNSINCIYVRAVTLHITDATFTNNLQHNFSEHCSCATSHLSWQTPLKNFVYVWLRSKINGYLNFCELFIHVKSVRDLRFNSSRTNMFQVWPCTLCCSIIGMLSTNKKVNKLFVNKKNTHFCNYHLI